MQHVEQRDELDRSSWCRPKLWLTRLESWLEGNLPTSVFILLAAGLLVRLWHASGTYLNPDEALHFFVANQTTWWGTYKESLILAHPPLLIFLLHLWRRLGTTELMLRLPSILMGLGGCWLAYRWLLLLVDEAVALTSLVFLLFLPSSIELSTEVRQYALLFGFSMAAGYLLELALRRNSVAAMLCSGLSLCLAIASHYSALLFALTLGLYALWRLREPDRPLQVFAAWEIGQIVALALSYFFYVTHLSQLGKLYGGVNAMRGFMGNEYLSNSYFVAGRINPVLFIFARTGGVLQYLFRQSLVGDLAYPILIVGLVQIFRHRAPARIGRPQLAFLLGFPFVANAAAALARAYPYGGTRHSFFLLPFATALVSAGLLTWRSARRELAGGALVALAVALFCNLVPAKRLPYLSRLNQRQQNMRAAIQFLRQRDHQAPIFTDNQSSLLLGVYLCDQRPVELNRNVLGFSSFECGSHRVIVANQFIFTARTFYDQWQLMIRQYRLAPNTPVWVTQMGWSTYLAFELSTFPQLQLHPYYFGNNLETFELKAGEKLPDPELLPTS
ncbi:MAG: glycosyltransferase family 39 protein [Acidobacteria bacterium]|nr:glycosyltransferase family 39 protein [Acidobacteriota bacterium]